MRRATKLQVVAALAIGAGMAAEFHFYGWLLGAMVFCIVVWGSDKLERLEASSKPAEAGEENRKTPALAVHQGSKDQDRPINAAV
jgi:hypothetical protein